MTRETDRKREGERRRKKKCAVSRGTTERKIYMHMYYIQQSDIIYIYNHQHIVTIYEHRLAAERLDNYAPSMYYILLHMPLIA